MAHNYIIQWNCRGRRSNREDIELLISKYSPAAICLQETLLTPHQTQTFKHYSAYYKSGINGYGGVCILVKNKFIHSQVQFQADLQALSVCITINNKRYTVASVYVPPSEAINELAFDRMIISVSSRYLILGDFNGHSHWWGANQENERGKIVEKLIDRHNLILLNDSVHTRFDTYHQTSSLLDLSLSSFYIHGWCVWDFIRQIRKWSPSHHYHRKYIWSSSARKSSKMEFQASQMGCIPRSMYYWNNSWLI